MPANKIYNFRAMIIINLAYYYKIRCGVNGSSHVIMTVPHGKVYLNYLYWFFSFKTNVLASYFADTTAPIRYATPHNNVRESVLLTTTAPSLALTIVNFVFVWNRPPVRYLRVLHPVGQQFFASPFYCPSSLRSAKHNNANCCSTGCSVFSTLTWWPVVV